MASPSQGNVNRAYYQQIVDDLLVKIYAKCCSKCGESQYRSITTRPYVARCSKCSWAYSKLAGNQLPQWMFGWIVDPSIIKYPQALTVVEIKNQLGISTQGAYNPKRRFPIFASEQQQKYKDLIRNDMKKLGRLKLPALGLDIKPWTSKYAIPHTDTMAVFSASQRCFKGRQRWQATAKGNGQTSSIDMNPNLGGKQIDSLINTFSMPGRGLILDCIPNQEAGNIRNLLVD